MARFTIVEYSDDLTEVGRRRTIGPHDRPNRGMACTSASAVGADEIVERDGVSDRFAFDATRYRLVEDWSRFGL
ncbi:hypothetical protein BG22_02200 [Bifidobacterium sp. UTBIF-78]|nr:hypothetical protein BG22_02200 [Bifidobacterium sp. UTBIF-78]